MKHKKLLLIKKTLVLAFFIGCTITFTQAQPIIFSRYDTLPDYPFLYKYGWDSVGVENNGVLCTVEETSRKYPIYNHNNHNPVEVAFFQHTDTPLKVVGIATGIQGMTSVDATSHLILYESNLKDKIAEIYCVGFNDYWPAWRTDTNYHHLVLPGKAACHISYPGITYATIVILKFAFFDEPVEVTGDYFIGVSNIYNGYEFSSDLTSLSELHSAPLHIGKTPFFLRYYDGWDSGDTLDGELPEVFLIIEPECQAVENITVTADSNGCLHAVWDSLPWQDLWVARLEGPSGVQYDTLDTTAHTYCGLDPDGHYSLSIQARCYRPGGHNWAQWSPSVSLGRAGIPFVEGNGVRLTVSPNPATGCLRVEGDDGRIALVDLQGHEVTACSLGGGLAVLDVSALPRGVYLLRLASDKGAASRRVVLL